MIDSQQRTIAKSNTYLIPFRYITGNIIEYDIRQANINILYNKGLLSEKDYHYYQNIPKHDREVRIGLILQKNSILSKVIKDGIAEFKMKLFEANDIQAHEVVRIASDAVYINRSIPLAITKFDNVEFLPKGQYNSYVNLAKILFFIKYINDQIDIDVKGIGEEVLFLHQEYLLSVIANIICTLEKNSVVEAIKETNEFIDDYVNCRLPVGYYREFTPESMYRIIGGQFLLPEIDSLDSIDINNNLYLMRELLSILYEIYYSLYKKV